MDKLLLLSMPVSDMVVLRVCLLLRQAGGGRGGLRQATEKHDDLQEAVSGCPSLMTSRKQGEKAAVKGPHQRGRRVRARARALQLRVAHREWAIAEEDVWSCSSTEQRSSGFYRARARARVPLCWSCALTASIWISAGARRGVGESTGTLLSILTR